MGLARILSVFLVLAVLLLPMLVLPAEARITDNPLLIKNGGFESCLEYWSAGAGAPFCRSWNPPPHSGHTYVEIGYNPEYLVDLGVYKETVSQQFVYSAAEVDASAWVYVPSYTPIQNWEEVIFDFEVVDFDTMTRLIIRVYPRYAGELFGNIYNRVEARIYIGNIPIYVSSNERLVYMPTDSWRSLEIVKTGNEVRFYAGGVLLGNYTGLGPYEFDAVVISFTAAMDIPAPVHVDDVAVYDIG